MALLAGKGRLSLPLSCREYDFACLPCCTAGPDYRRAHATNIWFLFTYGRTYHRLVIFEFMEVFFKIIAHAEIEESENFINSILLEVKY